MNDINNLEKQFKNAIDKAVNNFQYVYPTHADKIGFLKELESKNVDFINTHKYKALLEESMNLLVANAKVTETRKMQQQLILPLLAKMFQKVPASEINADFEKDSRAFTLFCITALSFKFEKTMKEHAETHHKNIIEVIDKYTSDFSKL